MRKAAPLTPRERAVLEILRADWQDLLRCTTLDQAMARVGMPATAEARCRLASVLLTDPDLREGMRWHPSTYILTNDEKVLARVFLRAAHSAEVPSLDDLARQAAVTLWRSFVKGWRCSAGSDFSPASRGIFGWRRRTASCRCVVHCRPPP